jgi:hypothetical protein
MRDDKALISDAKTVLEQNDHGAFTIPAAGLYPHQWLWDSCFIAIGLRHLDVSRAQTEILNLFRGQWKNGMLPHMIFNPDPSFRRDRSSWMSSLSPWAPDDVATSGITQPPMLAETVVRIGEKLAWPERRLWYRQIYDGLLAYHQWLYAERDPHQEGLVLQIHPWETGLDNTPPWMSYLQDHLPPWWIRALHASKLDNLLSLFRRDIRWVPADERFTNFEVLALYDDQRRLKRKAYDINRILDHSLFAIEDLSFNSIFIRANQHLRHIASSLKEELPPELDEAMKRTEKAFDNLWDDLSQQYYSRDFLTHKWLREPSIATLLPLYAGVVTQERAERLVKLIENPHQFGTKFPIPSVPRTSAYFDPVRYWQGPTWINTNWLIIDGLRRYGFDDHADVLTEMTLELVRLHGFNEYFNPLDGTPLGAANFSWSAALAIDLIKS